ncbi:hypothetical protein ACHWQZ_G004235 [Mnemiopsis leidyi]
MASESLTEELDFEDDTQNDVQEDEFYCSICSDCYDEAKEFVDHVKSSEHSSHSIEKLSSLQEGDKYCSICLTMSQPTFDDHCLSSDHIQFLDSLCRSIPDTPSPVLKEVDTKKPPLKAQPPRKKSMTTKMIGLNHIKRKDDEWFCNICLEKFSSVETHCTKAMHAIHCIKICDPDLAYEIKVSANQKGKKKIVSSIISSKVEEMYEKEKDTPEYIRTLMELEGVQLLTCSPAEVEETKDEFCQQSNSEEKVPDGDLVENYDLLNNTNKGSAELKDSATSSYSQDMGEMVSLFEEEDRSFIPMNDEVIASNSQGSTKFDGKKAPSKDATMIVGVNHLKLKGRSYYCGLCDIMCKTSLESCKLHTTSSLHRRRMINKFSAHPIPNYLEKLRTKDASLYNKLIKIETMKIELEERMNETPADQRTRAGILGIKRVEMLPEPLLNVHDLPEHEKSLDLMELARKWDAENNATIFQKSAKETLITGSNRSTISPIQPQIENILVGVKSVTFIKNSNFHCGLCNIKFEVKNKRNDKHHVNGRLHKKKALVAAYGKEVEEYLQHRSRKDGYDALNKIINQACVPLEKEEVESEPPASREIRAKLLGVKVEQLPLPMIIMFSNTEAFDIKMAICEWKSGKKNPGIRTSPSTRNASIDDKKSIVEPQKSVEQKMPDSPLQDVRLDSSPSSTSPNSKEELTIEAHPDSQSFEGKSAPVKVPSKSGNVTSQVGPARNIFDLCKPMPDASPEKPIFKTPGAANAIKNIDIDGLRKSLVDADLGEFVPVAKANPGKEAAPKNKRKFSSEEETPKSSKTEEERKRRRSGENMNLEKKKILAENIQKEIKGMICNSESKNPSNKSSGHIENPKRNNCDTRRTYNNIVGVKNVHQSSRPSDKRTKLHGGRFSDNASNHLNQMITQSNQGNHTNQQSQSRPLDRKDARNQPRGNSKNNQFCQNDRDVSQGRNNSAWKNNNNTIRNSGEGGTGNFGARGPNAERKNIVGEDNSGGRNHPVVQGNHGGRNNPVVQSSYGGRNNPVVQSHHGGRNNPVVQGNHGGRNNDFTSRRVNNSQMNNSADKNQSTGRNSGQNNAANNSFNSNSGRNDLSNISRPNTEYSNPGNKDFQKSVNQHFSQGHQGSSNQTYALNFDIDVGSIRNTNLSSALARVTNITPISQACSAKINEAAQNLRSNNQHHNTKRFPQPQSGTYQQQQNSQGDSNQFYGHNLGSNQGNNQGFGRENRQSDNFGNQGGHGSNYQKGFRNNSWGGNPNNNDQYGNNSQHGNHNYGDNNRSHNHGPGGMNDFHGNNKLPESDGRNNFQKGNYSYNQGDFSGHGKRDPYPAHDSFGYNDRQKRQRNDHYSR